MTIILGRSRFGCFIFGFQGLRPHLTVILDGSKIGRWFKSGCRILIIKANHVKHNCFVMMMSWTTPRWDVENTQILAQGKLF